MPNPLFQFQGICKRDRSVEKMFIESETGAKYFVSDLDVESKNLQIGDCIEAQIFPYIPDFQGWQGRCELGTVKILNRALDVLTTPYATIDKPKRKSK